MLHARVEVVRRGGGEAAQVVDGSWYVERASQPDRLALVARLGRRELVQPGLQQVGDALQQLRATLHRRLRPPDSTTSQLSMGWVGLGRDFSVFGGLGGWSGSVAEWLACWTQAQKARIQNAAATLSGNSHR